MDSTAVQEQPLVDMIQLAPTIYLYLAGLVLIALRNRFSESVLHADWGRLLGVVALSAAAWQEVSNPFGLEAGELLLHDGFSRFFKLSALIGATALIVFYHRTSVSSEDQQDSKGVIDFISVTLLSAGGLMFLASAYDIFAIVLGAELAIAPLYLYFLFSSYDGAHTQRSRWRMRATTLRVVSFGAFSSLLLVFGVVLLYGISGATDLIQVRINLSIVFLSYQKIGPALLLASTLITVGLVSKMGLAPFHFWLASLNSEESAALSPGAVSLALYGGIFVGVIGVMRLFDNALVAFSGPVMSPLDWPPALLLLVTLTTTIAAAVAFRENSLRLQLFWLTLAQGAFALVGPLLHSEAGLQASLYHFFVLMIVLTIAHSIIENVLSVPRINPDGILRKTDSLDILRGLGRTQPLVGLTLALCLGSLGALPLTGGFIARYDVAQAALSAQEWWAFVITVVTSVVLGVVCLRMIYAIYQNPSTESGDSSRQPQFSFPMRFAGAMASAVIIYLGVAPDTLRGITQEISRVFAF